MENVDQTGFYSNQTQAEKILEVKNRIANVIAGQEHITDLILTAILANGHVLIEGVPGVAKTLTARLISKLINAEFSRMQFTSDLMPSDVLGTNVFNMSTNTFEFHRGPAFGDIILVDEINRAPAKTQSALFEVMEERQITVDGVCYPLGDIYTIVATQNPVEQEGTYRLPEAQLDRFLFKLKIGYPKLEDEIKIISHHNSNQKFTKLSDITSILTKEDIIEMRKMSHNVFIDNKLMGYIASIVQGTRSNKNIYLGASPRASIALMVSAKAFAFLQGRNYVVPDDIKMMTEHVLCHRISLTAEAEMSGLTEYDLIKQIVEQIEIPK